MTRQEFFETYVKNVRFKITTKEMWYAIQNILFEFGVRVHSDMDQEEQKPIIWNLADKYPEYIGTILDFNHDNLVVYDEGKRLQISGFYYLESDKKEVDPVDFLIAYASIKKERVLV